MQKNYFILILALYIAIVVAGAIVESLTASMIPSTVAEMEKAEIGSPLILIIAPVILLSGIIGFIGMLFFLRPATYIFTAAVITKIILSPILGRWAVTTSWSQVFFDLEILLDGIIITLIFIGPAKILFVRKQSS